MILYYIASIIAFSTCFDNLSATATYTSPCGDWEQYKDEHCYKLLVGLMSFDEAEKVCQSNNASMVSIHYAEEQNFLQNYIFTQKKTVDNVWIGARYINNKQFKWADQSTLTGYSNWAAGSPKNLANHCVEMLADVGLEGKWAEGRCAKGNRVLCQRMPLPSIWHLAHEVIELKHSLVQTTSQLAETKTQLESTIKSLTAKIAEVEKSAALKLSQTTNSLTETKNQVAQLRKESIPLGFIYVQLPKDKAPTELWPTMSWKDVSAEYEGVFFRVVGGGSASFGQLQQWNAPRLEAVHISNEYNMKDKLHSYDVVRNIPVTGWSESIYTGEDEGSFGYNFKLKMSDIAEVRPKNMAIKVYKRIA